MSEITDSFRHPRSYLFTIRVWVEPSGDDRGEVRMQVRHVLSGETRYFRNWPEVVAFLLAKLPALDAEGCGEGGSAS
jgi:hypothetical protein